MQDWKSYRLKPATVALLEAIRRSQPHTFLSFDELFAELTRFYLARQPTIRAEVKKWLAARSSEGESSREGREE